MFLATNTRAPELPECGSALFPLSARKGSLLTNITRAPEPGSAEAHSSHKRHNRSVGNIREPEPETLRPGAQSLPCTQRSTYFPTIITSAVLAMLREAITRPQSREEDDTIRDEEKKKGRNQNSTRIPNTTKVGAILGDVGTFSNVLTRSKELVQVLRKKLPRVWSAPRDVTARRTRTQAREARPSTHAGSQTLF